MITRARSLFFLALGSPPVSFSVSFSYPPSLFLSFTLALSILLPISFAISLPFSPSYPLSLSLSLSLSRLFPRLHSLTRLLTFSDAFIIKFASLPPSHPHTHTPHLFSIHLRPPSHLHTYTFASVTKPLPPSTPPPTTRIHARTHAHRK